MTVMNQSNQSNCIACGVPIDPARLEVLPQARTCVACAEQNPEPVRHDPNVVCAKSSITGRNGFAAREHS